MKIWTTKNDLIERRKTWQTVSFGGIKTYDAFDRGGKIRPKDKNRIKQHIKHLGDLSWDYLHENVWDDIFVEPSSAEFQNMDCYEIQRLIDLVVIPHIHVFSYRGAGIHRLQRTMPTDSVFVPADEFLHCVRALPMVNSGADVLQKLIEDNNRDYFEALLKNRVTLDEDDFKAYKRQLRSGKCKQETLFLVGWIKNRLSHPENRFECLFPDVGDYSRSTYLISAMILVLHYKNDTPMFG